MPSSTTYKQQPSQNADSSRQASSPAQHSETTIREVWAHNFKSEFTLLLEIVLDFKRRGTGIAIGLNVEFPGFLRQEYPSASQSERYEALRDNVNMLSPIQIGLAIASCDSAEGCAWSFNLRFDLSYDLHMDSAIKSLENSGFRFGKHAKEGIDPVHFGKWLADSGLVGQHTEAPLWITYGGAYDLGYLLKVLGNESLPKDFSIFEDAVAGVCPSRLELQTSLDAKSLSLFALRSAANTSGQSHTAGRDAMTVLEMYFSCPSRRREELKFRPPQDGPMLECHAEKVAPAAQWAGAAKSVSIEAEACARYLPKQEATSWAKTTCDDKVSILVEECPSADIDSCAPAALWGMVARSVAVEVESSASQHLTIQDRIGSTGTTARDSNPSRACASQIGYKPSLLEDAPARNIARHEQPPRIPDHSRASSELAAHRSLWSRLVREFSMEADATHDSGRDLARDVEANPIDVTSSSTNSLRWQQACPQYTRAEDELKQALPPSLWAAAARRR